MIRFILIIVGLALLILVGVTAALQHFFGWKGLIAVPFLLIAMIWIGKKVAGAVIKTFATKLFEGKASVLKGAAIIVHSVTPTSKPVRERHNDSEDEETEESEPVDASDAEDVDEDVLDDGPRCYYEVDMTITPQAEASEAVWEPGEFLLTCKPISNLGDLDTADAGAPEKIQVWDGTAFGSDDVGKYPGEQRLKITFALKPGTKTSYLQYYNQTIGQLEFPEASLVQ